jgi:hypothetical protein
MSSSATAEGYVVFKVVLSKIILKGDESLIEKLP